MRIKISTNIPNEPLIRQTPGGRGVWKDCEFILGDPRVRECDVWVVLEGIDRTESAFVRRGATVFLAWEPPDAEDYEPGFLDQFDLVVAADESLSHRNLRQEYQGLPWHVGIDRGALADQYVGGAPRSIIDYDGFRAMSPPVKTSLISTVVSSKPYLPGHRRRLAFLDALKRELGDELHVFGRGVRPVADKLAAIAPYEYHLVLENSAVPHYWTEKLADSFLGFSYPIYWGCPNIADYFPPASLTAIDIAKPAEAISTLRSALSARVAERNRGDLLAARDLVLDRYNTFDVIRRACIDLAPRPPRWITLRPQRRFIPLARKATYAMHALAPIIPGARRLHHALRSAVSRCGAG